MGKKTKVVLLALVVVLLAVQLVQPSRVNPSSAPADSFEVVASPPPQARAIIARACQDCHSNRTVWPWYSRIAPASWLVADDVSEGREHMNLSEWGKLTPERRLQALGDICREVTAGDMPLWQYRLMHPGARLAQGDRDTLCLLSVPPR
ncbi:MAG: heme-binding domain-containing protein [Bryobacteraceae bacterium]